MLTSLFQNIIASKFFFFFKCQVYILFQTNSKHPSKEQQTFIDGRWEGVSR